MREFVLRLFFGEVTSSDRAASLAAALRLSGGMVRYLDRREKTGLSTSTVVVRDPDDFRERLGATSWGEHLVGITVESVSRELSPTGPLN